MYTVLVTGASGFVGGAIVKHLRMKGECKVVAVGPERFMGFEDNSGVDYRVVDFARQVEAKTLFSGVDCVIHCGGLVGDWGKYEAYYDVNVRVTEKIIDWCKAYEVKRLVYFSSPSVYFDFQDHLNVTEDFRAKTFSSHFAKTKFLAECAVLAAHSDHFKTIALRPRLVLGEGDRHVFPLLIRLHEANVLRRVGKSANMVSTTHIDNLLHALDCVMLATDDAWGQSYNIADEQPVRLWDVVDVLFSRMGLKALSGSVPYALLYSLACIDERLAKWVPWGYRPRLTRLRVAMLARSLTVSIAKAKTNLGYCPQKDVYSAIEDFVHWWARIQQALSDGVPSSGVQS